MPESLHVYNVPDEVMQKLKDYAAARGLTLSSAVKSILAEYLRKEGE